MPLSKIHSTLTSDHILLDGTDSTGANANSKLLLDASAVDTDVNVAISYEINSNDAARQSFETIQVNNLKKRDGRNFVYSNRNKIINGDFIISQRGTTFTASDNESLCILLNGIFSSYIYDLGLSSLIFFIRVFHASISLYISSNWSPISP